MQPRQPRLPNLSEAGLHAVALAGTLALCAMAYAAVYRPLADWRGEVARRADLVKEKLAEGPAIRQRHAERTRELQELLASVEEVNRRVPDKPSEGEFLGDLSRLAREHGVEINDFRRGKVATAATHSVVSISITGEASHAGLCELVASVSQLPRLASLNEMRVRSEPGAERYPVELGYSLYYGLGATE